MNDNILIEEIKVQNYTNNSQDERFGPGGICGVICGGAGCAGGGGGFGCAGGGVGGVCGGACGGVACGGLC